MGFKRLLPHEKIYLRFRGRKDVRKRNFKSVVLKEHRQKDVQTQDNGIAGTGANLLPPEGSICVSPFMKMELEKFGLRREHYIGLKRFWTWSFKESGRRKIRISTFSGTLSQIDSLVNQYSSELDHMAVKQLEVLRELERKKEIAVNRQEPHMVQLYINKAADVRRAYYDSSQKYYRRIISLLSKKITLIEKGESKLTALRRRVYYRLQYYYQAAAMRDRSMPIHLSDVHFESISNMTTMEGYALIRKEAAEKLEEFKNEIGSLKSGN